MLLELTTQNIPFLDCGLYNSILGEVHSEEAPNWDTFDREAYMEEMGAIFSEYIDVILGDNFDASMGAYTLWSPKFYNYITDALHFEVEIPTAKVYRHVLTAMQNVHFVQWLENNYSSYDGFHSNVPTNLEGFKEYTKEKPSDAFAIALQFRYEKGEIAVDWDRYYSNFQRHIYGEVDIHRIDPATYC